MALVVRCGERYNVTSSLDDINSMFEKDWSK